MSPALLPGVSHADRRYFLQSYTPYLSPAGELELEIHSIARNGQGDSTNTGWTNRASLRESPPGTAFVVVRRGIAWPEKRRLGA